MAEHVTSPNKQCYRAAVHPAHQWWSRKQHCFFHCFGRTEPKRVRQPKSVSPQG